ncbi:MAG: LmeA family phospholipid-binding protein [Candidatus Limnocylindria bacterium]|nr:LmeA family phospholipid-binding protein [Candidatus Limnocylindria bacterium]
MVRIVLGAALAGVAIALLRTSVAPRVSAPATSAPAPSSAPAAAIPGQVARPTPAAFAMTMSEAELTKAAASGFPQTMSGVTVSDPEVHIETAGVRLTARAKVLFATTQFVLTATPTATAGQITVRVDTATLAGVALPDSTRASIAETVQSTISKLIPANVRVTSITFAPGRLSVQGTRP